MIDQEIKEKAINDVATAYGVSEDYLRSMLEEVETNIPPMDIPPMDNIELMVTRPEIILPLGWDKDGQTKRRERRKSSKKDKSRWHIKQTK